ncbi:MULTISPECIES: DNA repair ATPase [unclassified Fusibacter]|uniref:DNA repair ATPase n=1 Tax=unclassified Fusibacter TaxID=2624464 RepID=UPI00101165D1|nr:MULTISPECIES: DNA repair ATPase [unclassified Fusibacter]MCK8058955.1 DNA repair ATPase [Fusibacter sp. A2]NPE22032.1 AAA family ATPase [Fusibacter sp. A1]RXV61596.1 AAA family ATPase [Fusibacter sp. A1]
MDSGTYEVIKSRLEKQGVDLKTRAEKLNATRKDVFGSVDTKLLASERILTENNCIPRDMAPVDDCFLFGYNVHIGLKQKVELEDVFSIYKYGEEGFIKESLELINDDLFKKDFDDLYQYYKNTFFAKFTISEPYFYMVFQTGKAATDIKVFKWLIEGRRLIYVDNRSEHEVKFNLGNDFDFQRATRDQQRTGIHPHVSILDKVFVETIGGDLTIKVEDNTETGKGIYSEVVEDKDQNLDDAEIYYVDLDQLILLKILPYKEKAYRYFVFNNKLKNVVRVDSMEHTCKLLPGGHGLIFPQGYYLRSGEYKLFDVPLENAVFDQIISSTNGEDYQYIFYNMDSGTYLMYSYNMIEQTIEMPIVCSGYSHFNSGEMIVFRHENEPRKNHSLQVWQTPYVGKNHVAQGNRDSVLYKIGNKDVVDCIAACRGVGKLVQKGDSYQSVYLDIVKETQNILDSYFWVDKDEAFNLAQVLKEIKETSTFAIGEFEKVIRMKEVAKKQIELVGKTTEELLKKIEYGTFENINEYVDVLGEIRNIRGEIVSLRDLMYTDLDVVQKLEDRVKEKNDAFSEKCVAFIVSPDGLKPYEMVVDELHSSIESVEKSLEGNELAVKMDKTSTDLELLMEIVSNFKIEDPTVTTELIEKISALFSLMNNAKAKLKVRIETFTKTEMTIQFNAQMKLLGQAVLNYLEIADTEDKCDNYLNKVMVQLQELEGKFSEFEEYLIKLDEKREEIYSAFESRKQTLLDKLNKRLVALFDSSQRIIGGIQNRLMGLDTIEMINGYLASDIMAEKVRDIISELRSLGDSVKADEVSAKLKSLKENAIRQLKDKQDLYLNGQDVIKFGNHHFSVNRKAIDLSIVQKDNQLYYHITGTDFWDRVVHRELSGYQHVFEQTLVSENADVYRGEYLAYTAFEASRNLQIESLQTLYDMSDSQLLDRVRTFMETRYQEGYTKGVHDEDATKILSALLHLHHHINLLTYQSDVRSMARLFWSRLVDEQTKTLLSTRLNHLTKVGTFFKSAPSLDNYLPLVVENLEKAFDTLGFYDKVSIEASSEYLCKELMQGTSFVISLEAKQVYDGFKAFIRDNHALESFEASLKASKADLEGQFFLVKEWVLAYWNEQTASLKTPMDIEAEDWPGILNEVVVLLLEEDVNMSGVIQVPTKTVIEGLVGSHGVIADGTYELSYTKFMSKMRLFSEEVVDDYLKFNALKSELIKNFKEVLRLDDFKPNVLTSFVRNRLIDKVYLPLVGENLAKQMGVVGDDKRTDLMGLLLLVSPPGYGKTTLMEYIASRLGIILVKINGPSLGNEITSLDPDKASHSSAKEELRKLNLALKMGNNVMLYLDDIQHCDPEFLQKFISLCDGQRKIEGVYNGVGQTYDLRGKKIAVVMAGNPYTESGAKFKIPDMLANRADVYNLGDMLRENEEAFKLSYIENSLTSNPVLSKLSSRSQSDLYGLVQMANGVDRESITLESSYTADELNEYTQVITKLSHVRDIVLRVNMEYIHSAAQSDEYRNEPPFKLQGSYRNMNKIAQRVVSVMNDTELTEQIIASYENDCQTLTTGAESNLLKWKEITGHMNEHESARYSEIKQVYQKSKLAGSDDKMGQAVVVLSDLRDSLCKIKDVFEVAVNES